MAFFESMKILNQNNIHHEIKIIPRFYPCMLTKLHLYNESTQEEVIVDSNYNIVNGYLYLFFDYTFTEYSRYQLKVLQEEKVVYRGKIFVTDKDTQEFLKDETDYYYE